MSEIKGLPWATLQPDGPCTTIHVVPMNDDQEHELHEQCWCQPQADAQQALVLVHNSSDGREPYELGERKMN